MSGTVSQEVKDIIAKSPFLSEMLIRDIVSYSNLANEIRPRVEERLGKSVNPPAVVMALRRHAEELREEVQKRPKMKMRYELSMKTNIFDVNLQRNDESMRILNRLYENVQLEKGDFLNVSLGTFEMSISISDKYTNILKDLIKEETVLNEFTDLVAINIAFSDNFVETPGLVYMAVRKLAFENINVIEIVSTMNVLTFVVERTQSMKAYEVLQTFLEDTTA